MLRKERKGNHKKCLMKTTKSRKKVEDKNRERTKATNQISSKYGRYYFNCISNHVEGQLLNASITRQRFPEWLKKIKANYILSIRNTLLNIKDTYRFKVNR